MSRPRLRTRLTLLHAGLTFICCGIVVVLTALLPLLTARSTTAAPGGSAEPVTETNLPELLRDSAYVLVSLIAVSLALGWLIAGRALRPLDVITSSARSLSANTLDSRLRAPAAYREFTDLADTLEGLRKRLHESFSAQRQFVANASHELRTPLTVQRTLLQLTLADPDATVDTFRSACRELLDLSRQQEDLIDALLTLARGHQGIDHWEEFDLAELTRKAVADHAAEAGHRGIRIRTALAPATAAGDPRLAASLITNLVVNSLRHNVPGGSVDISTAAPGRLTVGNSGAPIPPAKIGRLFHPFQRLGPDRLGPDRLGSDRLDPDGLRSDCLGPDRLSPDQISLDTPFPDRRGLEDTTGGEGLTGVGSANGGSRSVWSGSPGLGPSGSGSSGSGSSGSGSSGSGLSGSGLSGSGASGLRSDSGHGLGLAIVAAIADAHRASVVAVPRSGGGLDVTVDFPAAPGKSGAPLWQEKPS